MPPSIQDRDADVWEPLIAVADAVGGDWPDRARAAAVALVADFKEVEASLGVRLLDDLRVVFGDATKCCQRDILDALWAMEEAPWVTSRASRWTSAGSLGCLRQYGVKSRTIRRGCRYAKGYLRAELLTHGRGNAPGPNNLPLASTPNTSDNKRDGVVVRKPRNDVTPVTHVDGLVRS